MRNFFCLFHGSKFKKFILLAFFLSIFACEAYSQKYYTFEQDSLALVDLYNSTNGASWKYHDKWLSEPVWNWQGINGRFESSGADSVFRVTEILLFNNNLNGTIPSSLGAMSKLITLHFATNSIHGNLPSELGNLKNLKILDFDLNDLTGPIPASYGGMTNLESLDLDNNLLSGPLPESLGQLKNLQVADLLNNQFSGSIPASIGDMTNLEILLLSKNNLTGTIPPSLGQPTNLKWIDLSFNHLEGEIPVALAQLSNLEHLLLANNELIGNIPADLSLLSKLKTLDLSNNLLSGQIPGELGVLKYLQFLILSSNKLTGTIPVSLGSLSNVLTFSLASNQLSGIIPDTLAGLTSVYEVHLDSNQFSGEIPSQLSRLENMTQLTLSMNQLIGTIPSSLGTLRYLQILSLGSNKLTGMIPNTFGGMIALKELRLSENMFCGRIPEDIQNLSRLTTIFISHNMFEYIPDLTFFKKLKFVDISYNALTMQDVLKNISLFTDTTRLYFPQADQRIALDYRKSDGDFDLVAPSHSAGDLVQWYNNGSQYSGSLTVSPSTDLSTFTCDVTNPTAPGLTIHATVQTPNQYCIKLKDAAQFVKADSNIDATLDEIVMTSSIPVIGSAADGISKVFLILPANIGASTFSILPNGNDNGGLSTTWFPKNAITFEASVTAIPVKLSDGNEYVAVLYSAPSAIGLGDSYSRIVDILIQQDADRPSFTDTLHLMLTKPPAASIPSISVGPAENEPVVYPNPGKGKGYIRYSTKREGHIRIEVLNMLGNKLDVLTNKFEDAGSHGCEFDLSRFPTGRYFIRLQSGVESSVTSLEIVH